MTDKFRVLFTSLLALGDIFSLLAAFTVAYILRVTWGDTDPAVNVGSLNFISFVAILLPFWVILFYVLGLYSSEVYERHKKEIVRLVAASVIGIMMMISVSFMINQPLFPAKMVVVYSLLVSIVLLIVVRKILYALRSLLFNKGIGSYKAIVVGNNDTTKNVLGYLNTRPWLGYEIVAVVSGKKYTPESLKDIRYRSLSSAIKKSDANLILQTDMEMGDDVYKKSVDNHLEYAYIPDHKAFITASHETGMLAGLPVVGVKNTPLYGYGKAVKRLMDILGGLVGLILSSPLWIVTIIAQKISEPNAPIFFKQKRYSRQGKVVNIYKFRSMNQDYSGMSAEEAFEKMGKPELTKTYYENGQMLDDDPRITKLGKIIRATSIDELPQFINVLKGDISLVGPRALPIKELDNRNDKSMILQVKSGLTGLAQVSGRRDISFDERRIIDVYYVNNWSLRLDIVIILKTIVQVLLRRGAV
ncbi:hypothetical protein CR969_02950 [Candidatus Saccharibacteria bacterium]|nr:MAG: hypothetical protein CR969_02950 [Candidatus Saccharibacteria bacterium]